MILLFLKKIKKNIFPLICFLVVFNFLFNFDVLVIKPTIPAIAKIAFSDIVHPFGSIETDKTKVMINEIFNITITGRDDQDVASIFILYDYDGKGHRKICDGVQKRCVERIAVSKNKPGAFSFYGFVRDTAGNESWTTPRKIEVNVSAHDIIPPTGTIRVDKTTAKIRETFNVTVVGRDNKAVRDIFFYDGDRWRRHRCHRDQIVCVKSWRISKREPGAFFFYGFVRDTAGPDPGHGSWIGPANIIITE